MKLRTIILLTSTILSGCTTWGIPMSHNTSKAHTIARFPLFVDEKTNKPSNTFFTGSTDATKRAYHLLVKEGEMFYIPETQADAAADTIKEIRALLESDKISGKIDGKIINNETIKTIAARTETVELVRTLLFNLIVLEANEAITPQQASEKYDEILSITKASLQSNGSNRKLDKISRAK